VPSETTGATRLAGRYAFALYELAESEKRLDPVAADLDALGAMISDNPDLKRLIRSPVISRADQGRAMAAVLEQAGANPLTGNFIGVVAENGRLFALNDMIAAYRSILAARRGEVTAEVTSAETLTDGQLKRITAALKAALGAKVAVDSRVDPGLLGGLVVKVGSRMIDSSLRAKLQHLRLAMKGAG